MPCAFTYTFDQGFVSYSDKATKVELEAAKFYFLDTPSNVISEIKAFLYRLEDKFFEQGLKSEVWGFLE